MDIPELDDNQNLSAFVEWLRCLLDRIVNDGSLIPNDLGAYARDALRQTDPQWTGLIERLIEASNNLKGDDALALERHGLTGNQLRFKLKAVEYCADAANEARPDGTQNRPKGMWAYLIRRTLGAADVVLDSILKALNADGALKEMKDMIMRIIE